MKFIGQGYYYNVYDLGNGRVRKIPRSQVAQFFQLFQWYILRPKILVREFLKVPYSKAKVEEQYHLSKKVISIASHYFGNASFDGYICEQDKGTPLVDLVKSIPQETFIEYCKEYAHIVHELWKLGIGEKIFKFTFNAGLSSSGKVFMLDTNEFTFDKTEAESKVISKRPLRASSFRRLPHHLKPAVQKVFEDEFTREKFNQLWRKSVI